MAVEEPPPLLDDVPPDDEGDKDDQELALENEIVPQIGEDLWGRDRVKLDITEKRIDAVLRQNVALCEELTKVSHELEHARHTEDELQVTWRASSNMSSRQKVVAQNFAKNARLAERSEGQKALEVAQEICELKSVHTQLQSVKRQLAFAVDLQTEALQTSQNKIAARQRRIRKLEMAIYHIVAQAQSDSRLDGVVAPLVAKCGPLVHSVLSREAQRQALELTAEDDAARPQM
mmetsp:Transcript_35559/g.62795  ORF Transcript_35559/g.62795 Transcript_35559/m.62795 type:complete len:233 (+) Transcript_35559:35-733(+)